MKMQIMLRQSMYPTILGLDPRRLTTNFPTLIQAPRPAMYGLTGDGVQQLRTHSSKRQVCARKKKLDRHFIAA